MPPGELGKLVHGVLHDRGAGAVVGVDGLARLKIHVGVLRRAAKNRPVGRHAALAMCAHQLVVDHRAKVFDVELFDLRDFVRGAEAIKEVHEGNPRFERRRLRDQSEVHYFLHRVGSQQPESRLTHGHDVLVIAENRERMRRDGARRYVDHGRSQLARDLVHVGNHQQQALRRSERGSK